MKLSYKIALFVLAAIILGAVFQLLSLKEQSSFRTVQMGYSYESELTLKNHSEFELPLMNGKEAGKAQTESETSVSIEEIPMRVTEGVTTSLLRLSYPHFKSVLNGQANNTDSILSDTKKEIWIERDRDGRILDVRLAADINPVSIPMLTRIAYAQQAALPEHEDGRWKSVERDNWGVFETQYEVSSTDGDLLKIRRLRGRFQKLLMKFGNEDVSPVTAGSSDLIFDQKQGHLSEISGKERIDFVNHVQRPLGYSETQLKWVLKTIRPVTTEDLQNILQSSAQSLAKAKPAAIMLAERSANEMDDAYRQRLGNDDLNSILRRIKGTDSFENLGDLKLKLNAFIALHPNQLQLILDEMSAADPRSLLYQSCLGSLVSLSTPEAQTIILDLLEQRQEKAEEAKLLLSQLGFLTKPIVDVENSLQRFRQNEAFRQVAELSLANLGSGMKEETLASRRAGIANDFLLQAESVKDDEEWQHILDVLGNLDAEEAIPFLQRAMNHESAVVRAKAAFALRGIHNDESREILLRVLQVEKDPDVRIQAAVALQRQRLTSDTLSEQSRLLGAEGNPRVRFQLLENVSMGIFVDAAETRRALESRLIDADDQVKIKAAALLAELTHH